METNTPFELLVSPGVPANTTPQVPVGTASSWMMATLPEHTHQEQKQTEVLRQRIIDDMKQQALVLCNDNRDSGLVCGLVNMSIDLFRVDADATFTFNGAEFIVSEPSLLVWGTGSVVLLRHGGPDTIITYHPQMLYNEAASLVGQYDQTSTPESVPAVATTDQAGMYL